MSARKSGGVWRYRVVVKLPDGSKVRVSGTPEINTRAAAEREERLHVERLKAPGQPLPRASLKDFAACWLDERIKAMGNKESTRLQRESHLKTRIAPFFFSGHLVDVTTAHIAEFRSKLLKELSPRGAASVMTTLALLLRDAHDAGVLVQFPHMSAPIKVPDGKKEGFTDEEQLQLLLACDTTEEITELVFALDTGARASEQLAVRWTDIDLSHRRIYIRLQRYMGDERETKTSVERFVDMTERLHLALTDRHSAFTQLNGYVFCDEHGRPRTYSHLQSLINKLCRRAKIEGSWHKARHTFSTRAINRGVPPHVIQRWLGHTSLEHTMEYAHPDDGLGAQFIKALD